MRIIKLQRRPDADISCLPAELPPLLRKIYASRGVQSAQELDNSLRQLTIYTSLTGIDGAVARLVQAMNKHERIIIIGDFDADGATSTALCLLSLKRLGATNVDYLIPNRFEEGYGLSCEVVEQALAKGVDVILTVDNGISSHAGVELANQHGVDVVVTDHHLPGETLPEACAIVNPNLTDCPFPSKALAGVGVAFYLMLALRAQLRKEDWFTTQHIAEPNLAEYLDLVALGTVADVVALDGNNRVLVHQGLNRIRSGHCRVGIKALLEVANRQAKNLTASDLGFVLGPRLNAAGRLDNMSLGVALLVSDDITTARQLAFELDELNQARKEIELEMRHDAMQLCDKIILSEETLPTGLAIYHPDWHQGVIGILASRLKERFFRPVIAFAPTGDGFLKGSGRSIPGLHLRDALERIDTQHPHLITKFGGHALAAGLTIPENSLAEFKHAFETLVAQWLSPEQLNGVIWSDGELDNSQLTLAMAELLRDSGPWGQAFPEPVFDGYFTVIQQRIVGGHHLKLMLEPEHGGNLIDAIAFNIDTQIWPDASIRHIQAAYKLDVNEFRGNRNVQMLIEYLWPK